MQLMGYGISVFGSRFGIALNPIERYVNLIRFDKHPGLLFEIEAGFKFNGRNVYLPLTVEGKKFEFCDFDTTPTSIQMTGIDARTGIRIALKFTIPFRPRDIRFSVTPAIFIKVECERIQNIFRWTKMENYDKYIQGKFFIKFKNKKGMSIFNFIPDMKKNRIKIEYEAPYRDLKKEPLKYIKCTNYLEVFEGNIKTNKIYKDFRLKPGDRAKPIEIAFITYDKPVLRIFDELVPFKYTQYFNSIDDISKWVRENRECVEKNSRKVDEIFGQHTIGQAYKHLMNQTLHTWLTNTWFVVRPNGQDWYSCWEGNCYFHSTVDVEYTQTPFYLTVWPELLEMLLNEWSYFVKPGTIVYGLEERGINTIVMSHDMGEFTLCNNQIYPHDMPVEENANYILMMFAYYLRTGKTDIIKKYINLIEKLMDFILVSDTTGNGIPDKGTANTVDDGLPAIQYCSEQIYLGVKAMAAIESGIKMLLLTGKKELYKYENYVKKAVQTINQKGWNKNHYVVTITKDLDGLLDSWTNEPVCGEAEGWDEYHIYTVNGLVLLDMCGYKTLLDDKYIKEDLKNSLIKTELKYGCSHSSYRRDDIASHPSKIGWISMNMLRDISAAYRGIDFVRMIESYWDWQIVSNTQDYMGFHETFYGNTLCFYPRGIACFGYMDAIVGFQYSPVLKKLSFSPIRGDIKIPLLIFADWKNGKVPTIETEICEGKIVYQVKNFNISDIL